MFGNRRINSKMFPIIFFISIAVMLTVGVVIYYAMAQLVEAQMGNKCKGLATAVSVLIEQNADEYRQFIHTLDTESEYYKKIKSELEEIRVNNGNNIAFLYTEIKVSDKDDIMFVLDSEPEGTDKFCSPGSTDPMTETRRLAYKTQKITVGTFVTNRWGTLLSAYAPIFDKATGEFLGLAGVDASDEQRRSLMSFQARVIAVCIFMLIVIESAFMLELNRHVQTLDSTVRNRTLELEAQKEIAERERLEAQRANEAKTHFLTKMSHEIRTPMNAILGMSELILREDTNPVTREHAVSVKQAGTNLLALINDILDLSKIESGKLELMETEYEFASLLNDVISIIRMRVMEKPILFVTNIDSRLPARLLGDEARTRQALLNVLSNAVKYTREGYITFKVEGRRLDYGQSAEMLLSFEVTDTGIGLKPEDMPHLFDDFARFDPHSNRNVEGTGLGLPITRSLARLMGGDVTAQSAYGHGSTFIVTIPVKVASHKPLASVENPSDKHVLVYENRGIYADSVIFSLENLGVSHQLVSAKENFEEAVRAEEFQFIFISTMLFNKASKPLTQTIGGESALVLLAEYGETVASPDLRVIAMPAHPISIANILNRKEDESYYKKDTIGLHYVTPEARLLIVDDIPTNLRVAKGLIAPLGATTDTCLSGAEAVELARTYDYDIIFMDHMMPEMDGIGATAAIRALGGEKYEKLPIVALTANAIGGMQEMLLANGFNDYIAKPIETAKLYDVIDRWIPKEKRVVSERNIEPRPEEPNRERIVIDGVDTDLAIMLIGGNIKDYISVLTLFCEDANERFHMLERVPEEGGDLKSFTTQIHALKGVLATIGATEVSKKAAALEKAAKDADFETIRRDFFDFRENLSDLVAKIKEALPKREKNTAANTLSKEIFAKLSLALESKDGIKADRIIDSLDLNEYDEQTVSALDEITNSVLLFDFETAGAALNSLRMEA
ncbi:hypothetical protein FACS1894216_05940 [Synergistales bacterium]|nr:hypothetical protein FACS1894216_05940 [Synergistales bacterium]